MTIAVVLTVVLCVTAIVIGLVACVDRIPSVNILIICPILLICWIWYDCGAESGYSEEKLTELGYGEYYLDDNNEKQWRFHEGTPVEENEDGS